METQEKEEENKLNRAHEEPIPRRSQHSLRKVSSHLKEDWHKYVLQAFVVFSGIMIAFGLERWTASRIEHRHLLDAYELIAQEIKLDTIAINKNLKRFKSREAHYEKVIDGTLTRQEYDDCHFCHRIVTSLYFIYPNDKGFQHLTKQIAYNMGVSETLNNTIEDYYNDVTQDLPMWQKFISDDVKQNIADWKINKPWYHQREDRLDTMINYQFNSPEYRNMVYVQRNLIYKNYVPLLEGMIKKANLILKLIDEKLNAER